MAILNKPKYWFQQKAWRITLLVVGVVVVLALVVFNKQLANLTSLFGSKAGINQRTVQLNNSTFLDGNTSTPCPNRFTKDATTGRLMLNDDTSDTVNCPPAP